MHEVSWIWSKVEGIFFIAYFYVFTILMTISKLNRILRFLLEIKIFLKENYLFTITKSIIQKRNNHRDKSFDYKVWHHWYNWTVWCVYWKLKLRFCKFTSSLKVNRPTESSRVTPIPTGKILFVLVMRLFALECFPGMVTWLQTQTWANCWPCFMLWLVYN